MTIIHCNLSPAWVMHCNLAPAWLIWTDVCPNTTITVIKCVVQLCMCFQILFDHIQLIPQYWCTLYTVQYSTKLVDSTILVYSTKLVYSTILVNSTIFSFFHHVHFIPPFSKYTVYYNISSFLHHIHIAQFTPLYPYYPVFSTISILPSLFLHIHITQLIHHIHIT